jgi:DNA-binding beta-propeller fold protein YncE
VDPPREASSEDPYKDFVWPAPPDKARIRLVAILNGRADVETDSKLQKTLLGAGPTNPYDFLRQPSGVAWDAQGRLLVTDPGLRALIRFDRSGRRMDVFGVRTSQPLRVPLGVTVASDGTILVADGGLQRVLAFGPDGDLRAAYGKPGDFEGPADVVASGDGAKLWVTDSKKHEIVVLDRKTGHVSARFGKRGVEDGELNFPGGLAEAGDGSLYVVDQINARVQVFSAAGEYLETLGGPGTQPGSFVRPKDVAVDEAGLVYVTDAAFNNVQIFDAEHRLLTFVGGGGSQPGGMKNAQGVAVRGAEFAVVDQLNRRVQIFRFLGPKSGE